MPAPHQQGDDMSGLASLTPAELAEITSAAVGRAVRPARTRVTPIPYDWGSPATAGLWRVVVSGQPAQALGHDGQAADPVSYTYFVKLLRHPRRRPGLAHLPDQASRDEFVGFFPWRFGAAARTLVPPASQGRRSRVPAPPATDPGSDRHYSRHHFRRTRICRRPVVHRIPGPACLPCRRPPAQPQLQRNP